MCLTVYGIYLYTSMNENFNKARSCGVVEYKYLCCVHVGGNKKKRVYCHQTSMYTYDNKQLRQEP